MDKQLTDYVIDSMLITKGPRFKGDLMKRLKTEINREIKTGSSLFFNKLRYTPCDGCSYKRENVLESGKSSIMSNSNTFCINNMLLR